MVRRIRRPAVVLGLTLILGADACAQWRVVYLHAEGPKSSVVHAAAGPLQGGRIEVLDGYVCYYHPVIWNASPEDYIDLLPSWGRSGKVCGMDGPWQAGYVSSQSATYAALWSGSVESFLDLSPGGGYVAPAACDVAGSQQVGYAYDSNTGVAHAALWYGSAESFIDMNPEGARESVILGMGDGVQVGWGLFGTVEHAVLWRGSAESSVDMHPSDGYASRLYDTTGTMHVGYVNYTG